MTNDKRMVLVVALLFLVGAIAAGEDYSGWLAGSLSWFALLIYMSRGHHSV